MMEALANALSAIILQYINVWDQHIAHLTFIQCYMSILSLLKKKKDVEFLTSSICESDLIWKLGHCRWSE